MSAHTFWFCLTWAVVGAGLGHAFHPLAARLSGTRTPHHKFRSPVVAAMATAVLFGLLAWRTGSGTELLAYSCVALAAVPLIAIDLTELRLPTRLIWPACGAALALFATAACVDHNGPALLRATAGMLALPILYLTLALASRGGLGAGDVRLAALVGLALAWRSWTCLVAGTVIALVCAGVAGLVAIIFRQRTRHSPIPYGPAMFAGTFAALLLAET